MRFITTSLIYLLLSFAGMAQVQINNLSELLRYADEHSTDARKAQLTPQIAAQDVKLQLSQLYPRVNAFVAGDYYPLIPTQVIPAEVLGGAPGTFLKAQFGLPYVFQAGAELSIPLVDLEKWVQLQRSKAQYTQAQWSSKAVIERLHLQLVQSYYQLLVTRAVSKLNEENKETVTELVRIMSERKEAGILNPSDYNRSVNLQLNVETSEADYQRNIQQSTNSLNALLNIGNEPLTLSETLNDFNWPLLQQPSPVNNRPGWQEAATKVQVSELAFRESKKGALPKLNLNTRYAYNFQSQLESGSQNVEFQMANIGLRLDVPILRGSYYHNMQKKYDLQLQSARLEKESTTAALTQQHNDWFSHYSSAYNKRTAIDRKVAAASDNLRIARLNVKEGIMEFDEFNNIFMEYNRARMEYLQNLADGILYYLLSTQNF